MSAVHPHAGLQEHGARRAGAAVAIGLHAVALVAILSFEPARTALLSAVPIMVDIVAPPQPPAPPRVEPPKPRPMAKRELPHPVEPPPLMTMPAEAPAAVAAPAPPPAPIVPPAVPAPVAMAAAPTAVPITVPVFNADYLSNPAPPYPPASRRIGEQGRVILRVLVTPGGTADEVEVRTSSGFARLDSSARDTVRRWKFVPARRGSEPVPAWVLIPITFRLES